MAESHKIAWIMCPYCTDLHDGTLHAGEEDALPVDGDANVCGRCARVSIYDSTVPGGLRVPTAEEQEVIDNDEDIERAVHIVQVARIVVPRPPMNREGD